MRSILLISFLLFLTWQLSAQSLLPILTDGTTTVSTNEVCSPGISNKSRGRGLEISYDFTSGGALNSPTPSGLVPQQLTSLEALTIKFKIPVVNEPRLKVLLGYNHEPETHNFENANLLRGESVFTELNNRQLKENGFGLYVIRPINQERYMGLRLKASFNGDYDGWLDIDQRYASYSLTWAYGFKKSEDFEWGFGVGLSHDFRRTMALPFIVYNRNFNDQWGIEANFPGKVQGRHNINDNTILLFGYNFQSDSYSIDGYPNRDEDAIFHLNHQEIRTGISLERKIAPWVWMNVKAGYQFNLNTDIDATVDVLDSYSYRPANAPYLRFGIFVSPDSRSCK